MDPWSRPPLARLKTKTKINEVIRTVDKVVGLTVKRSRTLIEFYELIYGPAITILEMHDQKIKKGDDKAWAAE